MTDFPSDIGDFVIGESPIGQLPYEWQNIPPNGFGIYIFGQSAFGDLPFDWQQTVISQYANSPSLLRLISDLSQAIDSHELFDEFYDDVWNIQTAKGWGLDVWGRIVGVNRVVQLPSVVFFGFEEALPGPLTFGSGIFYTGQSTTTNYALTDDAYRQLILAKAAANICDGSIPSINRLLNLLFPEQGEVYVIDNEDMTMTYKFSWVLTPVQSAIVFSSGVLPRPTGIAVNYVQG